MSQIAEFVADIRQLPAARTSTASLAICTLAINFLSLGLPLLTLQVYDRILPNPGSGTLPVLITGLMIIVVLETVLRLSRTYLINNTGASFEYRAMNKAIDRVLNADMANLGKVGIGENLNRLSSVSRLKDFYNGSSLVVVIDVLFVSLFLGLIAYIGTWLALIPLAILGMFVATSFFYGLKLRVALQNRDNRDDDRYNFMIGALEGVHSLKAMSLENHFMRRYESYERRSTLSNYDVSMAASSSFNMASVFSHMMIAATITGGALMVLAGNLTAGGLIACILLSGRIMQPVQRGLGLWARYQDYCVAKDKASLLIGMPQMRWKNTVQRKTLEDQLAYLSLRDVGYYIQAQNRWLFNKVNLQMRPGICVHITGGHGVGRSVLLNMIAGNYRPSDGDILIDGQSVQDYGRDELARNVGLVTADSEIFRGTIIDNLTRFGLTDFEGMKDILVSLGIERDVSKLTHGYDTFLHGTEPDAITPGLKQRIAIARVLAFRPRVILFDDADRNLDRNGYKNIISTLGNLRQEACIILVTDDEYISRLAHFHYELTSGGLVAVPKVQREKREVYHAA